MDQSCLNENNRRYYLEIFQSKTNELKSEIQRLQIERKLAIENNQQYNTLSKITKNLSEQIIDLRNDFNDYNMARMNSFCDIELLKNEINDLHINNQQLESIIDQLHLEKEKKEKQIEQLENKSLTNKQINDIHQEILILIDQISVLEYELDRLIIDNENVKFSEEINENFKQCLIDIHKIQQTNLFLLSSISQMNSKNFLIEQYEKFKQDYNRLEQFHQQLINELYELKIQSNKINEEIIKYNNLDYLKHQANRRKYQLTIDKLHINQRRYITQMEIQNLQTQFELLNRQLHNDPIHQQLVDLENKLRILSQINSSDDNLIEYQIIKHQVLTLIHTHNQWLIQRLKSHS